MGLLLNEPLPLRKSGALGNFAEEFVLAHRFGDLTSGRFKLGRLDDRTFFAADHPMALDALFVDDQRFSGWEQALQSDGVGHTWTVAKLSAPAAPGVVLSATGTGVRSARTGALVDNPGDVAEYILRLAGRSDLWFGQLRAEAAEAGLRLAGSIDEVLSIRAWLDAVLKSAGAIWCPGMARLYPVTPSGYIGELDRDAATNVVATAGLDNTGDVLRLYYDPDKASGKNQHYIELTANPKRYGGFATDRSFDFLRSPSNAEGVARRILPWLAGERWDVEFDCEDRTVRPGQWHRLVNIPDWPFDGDDPVVMILDTKITPNTGTLHCEGVTVLSEPAAVVTGHSVGLPATREASVELKVTGNTATLVVFDKNDRPVKDARVSLDKGPSKKTNDRGEVTFTVAVGPTPKEHELAIQAPGKMPTVQKVFL